MEIYHQEVLGYKKGKNILSYWKKVPLWKNITTKEWYNPDWQIQNAIKSFNQVKQVFPFLSDKHLNLIKENESNLNISLTPFIAYQAIVRPSIGKQFIPSISEIEHLKPIEEKENIYKKTKCLIHRYPHRAFFFANQSCGANCRFCSTFKLPISLSGIRKSISYIESHPNINDVLITGGEPLMMEEILFRRILKSIYLIPHVKTINIDTRLPVILPFKISKPIVKMLKKYGPVYMNIHINHVSEITPEMEEIVTDLVDAGVQLGSQSVLLKGINNDTRKCIDLFNKLLQIKIRPYYMYICDSSNPIYRISIEEAFRIMNGLEGHLPEMAIPKLIYNLPDFGGEKVIHSNSFKKVEKKLFIRNFEGKEFRVK